MRPALLKLSAILDYQPSPWMFSAIVTVSTVIFMVCVSFLLFVLLGDHPDPVVHKALLVTVGASLVAGTVLIVNTFMQVRALRDLMRVIHRGQTPRPTSSIFPPTNVTPIHRTVRQA